MAQDQEDDDIPLLEDILRPGKGPGSRGNPARSTLTDEEIEAIAARVIEQHVPRIEEAIVRAIRAALETGSDSGQEPDAPDDRE